MSETRFVSITGSRVLPWQARGVVAVHVIEALGLRHPGYTMLEPDYPKPILMHGCQTGVDIFAAQIAYLCGAYVIAVVPGTKPVDPRWTKCCHETVVRADYHDRNDYLVGQTVAYAGVMLQFPMHAEEDERSRRSGTWSVIRKAERAGLSREWLWVIEDVMNGAAA